jgi:flagellin-like protein
MAGAEPMKVIHRSGSEAVSPVVAEILLVAITVVLVAVLYLMASGLLANHVSVPPVVAFSNLRPFPVGSYNATFSVADASQTVAITSYRFVLKVGPDLCKATHFAASPQAATVTVSGTVYRVTWTDLDGGGALTSGDTITVSGNAISLPRGTSFDLLLLWTDGSQLTHEPWATP